MKKIVNSILYIVPLTAFMAFASCKNNTGAGDMPDSTANDTITQTAAEAPGADLDTVNTKKDPVAP